MGLKHHFSNPQLLTQALTHSSVKLENYERLEFLGDRVLDLVIAEWVLELYPDRRESFLTAKLHACVCRKTLVTVGRRLDLESEIRRAIKGKIPASILADVCEALIGAVYLDAGLTSARSFIREHWTSFVTQEVSIDSKQALQEWTQKHVQGLPSYRLIEQKGFQHTPWFEVEVAIGAESARGAGPSLRVAQKAAAQNLLNTLAE